MSVINEIVSSGTEGGLTLDVYIRMECGHNGMWGMLVQSIVIKPGPDVDPVYELGHWFNQWVIDQTIVSNTKILKIKYI